MLISRQLEMVGIILWVQFKNGSSFGVAAQVSA